MIPLDQIDLPPVSLRRGENAQAFAALVVSIHALGVLQQAAINPQRGPHG